MRGLGAAVCRWMGVPPGCALAVSWAALVGVAGRLVLPVGPGGVLAGRGGLAGVAVRVAVRQRVRGCHRRAPAHAHCRPPGVSVQCVPPCSSDPHRCTYI